MRTLSILVNVEEAVTFNVFYSFIYVRTYWLIWALCGHGPSFACLTISNAVEYVGVGVVVTDYMATAVMLLVLVVWRVAAVAIGPHPAEYSDGEGGRRMGTP